MNTTEITCRHTCRGRCNAVDIAASQEKEAILRYAALRDECTYPDVKVILNELILQRQKSIRFLDELRVRLKERFEVLDQVQEGFNL
jgi:rubrerythrin